MKRIAKFTNFKSTGSKGEDLFKVDYTLDESLNESDSSGLSAFEEACLEEGIEFSEFASINESYFEEALALEEEILNEKFFKKLGKKLGGLVKKIAPKAIEFVKNNFGKIVGTLGLSLTGPLGPIAGLLTKGVTGLLSKINLKPGEKIDKTQLASAVSETPDLKKVGDVWTKTLQKLLDSAKKNPASFMTGDATTSVKNLAAIATAANQTVNQVSKEVKSGS